MTETEQWVWSAAREGRIANLNKRCATDDLEPAKSDPRWNDSCRVLRGAFITAMLTSKPWQDELPRRVVIIGARVNGSVGLVSQSVNAEVVLRKSEFDAPLILSRAELLGLDLSGSFFEHGIQANSLSVKNDFFLREGAIVRGGVLDLVKVHAGGDVSLSGASIEAGLEADSLQAYRVILNKTTIRGGPIRFVSAEIKGSMVLAGGVFEPEVTSTSPEATLNLDSIKISKILDLRGATVSKGIVWLIGANIGWNVEMDGATSLFGFVADGAQIGGSLIMRSASFAQAPRLDASDIKGNVDISSAKLPGLDLVNSKIGAILRLGSDTREAPRWQNDAVLNLNGTQAKVIQDRSNSSLNGCELSASWPNTLNVQGFSYDQLGARPGNDLRSRDACWYQNWLERDPYFSRQPYQQLARILQAQGDPDRANAVRFAARDRELHEAWRRGDYGTAILLFCLKVTIGYGIGEYTFRVLWWIGAVALIGTLVLVFSRQAEESKRADWRYPVHFNLFWPVWCFGASLDQLLPVVELNKEFTEFFNDPRRERLNSAQHLYFGIQALVGYLLGLALVAALSGVTQAN
ncbi:hypothetical protein IVB25_23500 [Bradyrhizobium sp. 193]|uniref:hypothetical protein n=1 Tax=Bradyrhizobium sp. 193 TaxID=2782661 RepID=UPI001FFC1829|nr:hypothetical protein [Bradyrhizobium sp. 193]MCK1485575.1 hypothetical protein [Bradyrhizobium sp. 193]